MSRRSTAVSAPFLFLITTLYVSGLFSAMSRFHPTIVTVERVVLLKSIVGKPPLARTGTRAFGGCPSIDRLMFSRSSITRERVKSTVPWTLSSEILPVRSINSATWFLYTPSSRLFFVPSRIVLISPKVLFPCLSSLMALSIELRARFVAPAHPMITANTTANKAPHAQGLEEVRIVGLLKVKNQRL